MGKPSIRFFVMNFILLFVIVSLILVLFDLHRYLFVFELVMLLIFIFLLAFGMFAAYHSKKWGWTIIGAVLILLLLDIFLIFLLTKTFETAHMASVIFSVAGLLIVLWSFGYTKIDESQAEKHERAKEYYPYIDKMEPKPKAESAEEQSMEKTFTPGKFIASKKANKFHTAKCDWAKKISKPNQLWFNSREEAEAKGFEADKCI